MFLSDHSWRWALFPSCYSWAAGASCASVIVGETESDDAIGRAVVHTVRQTTRELHLLNGSMRIEASSSTLL